MKRNQDIPPSLPWPRNRRSGSHAIRKLLACCVLSAAACSLANAGLVTVVLPFSGTLNPLLVNQSESISLSQFNPVAVNAAVQSGCTNFCSAVTLQAIDFSLSGTAANQIDLGSTAQATLNAGTGTYSSIVGGPYSIVSVTKAYLTDPAFHILDELDAISGRSTALTFQGATTVNSTAPGSGTGDIVYGTGVLTTGTGSNGATLGASDLQNFIGNGNLNLSLSLSSGIDLPFALPNLVSAVAESTLTGSVQVRYTYTYTDSLVAPTPEPVTLALFLPALAGIAIFGRRRR